jgi:glycosyltransferase involved in cell wall biosynthesis
MRFTLWSRRVLARRSRLCILPSAQRIERFTSETSNGQNLCCVWNCPTQEEVNARPSSRRDGGLSVWYHGSIVPPQLPTTVLIALTQLPENVTLRVVGYETLGHQGYVRQLQTIARQLGIRERVEFPGTVPTRRQLLKWCETSDVGIALFARGGHQPMVGASNKPFDYLASGLAVLVSDSPDWRQMYVDPGYGLACDPDDPTSIASTLRWFLDHPAETRAMGERGRERILSEWNYERQFVPVLEALNPR